MTAMAIPIPTTTQRKTVALIFPANFPPAAPPAKANTAMINATHQLTFPEKTKKIAADMFVISARICFSAFKRTKESLISIPERPEK